MGSLAIAIANADQATASVTSPACGIGTVRLTVTDDDGRQDTADVVITPNAASTTAPANASPTAPAAVTPAVMVAVCPAAATVQAGTAAQPFVAYVANAANTAVSWQVNGIAGGNAAVGTVSSSGEYTPPTTVKRSTTVSVTAVSAADATVSSAAQVTITPVAAPSSGGGGGGGASDWFASILVGLLAAYATVRRFADRSGEN